MAATSDPHLTRRAALAFAAAALVPLAARAATPDLASPGMRDATETLQAAIDAAAKEGRPLLLGPGPFRVTTLRLPDGLVLTGSGAATRIEGTGGEAVLSAEGTAAVTLRDFALSALVAVPLVLARKVALLDITECRFTGGGIAIRAEGCGGRISRCRISGASDVAVFCRDGQAMAITDNDIADCGDGGILVHRSSPGPDGAAISGNRIAKIGAASGGTGQNGNGINVFRADNVVVTGNRIADCAFSAIRGNAASNLTMTGNQALRSGETALYAEFGFQGVVIANNIVDGAVLGISVTNFNEGGRLAVISGNLLRNLGGKPVYAATEDGFGIGIGVEADAAVTGNVIENAVKGIGIGTGRYTRDVTATGNLIRAVDIGFGVSAASGAGAIHLEGNLIDGAKRGAVIGMDNDTPVTGDLTLAGAKLPANLTMTGNRIVR